MLIRQSKNAFIRIFSRYAYVENQANHVSMTYTGDEMKFVSCLSRKAQDLECVAGNAGIDISVAGELAKNLADLWFVVIGDCVNIRSGPGTEYEKVASGQNGASVVILGEENGWYQIDYGGGKTGYVLKEYVSVTG